MNQKFILGFIIFVINFSIGQSIHLTGRVRNNLGDFIPNATVTLIGKNLSSITNDSGVYTISNGLASSRLPYIYSPQIKLQGNRLNISIQSAETVTMTMHDLSGKKLKQILRAKPMSDREYSFNLSEKASAGIAILRLDAGNYKESFKILNSFPFTISIKIERPVLINSIQNKYSPNSREEWILAKALQIVDTVEVSKTGYYSKAIEITEYVDSLPDIIIYKDATTLTDCPPVSRPADFTGCRIWATGPPNCAVLTESPTEFSWQGDACHTPYYVYISGEPMAQALISGNYTYITVNTTPINANVWAEPIYGNALDLVTSLDGWYHWMVCNAYDNGCSEARAFMAQ